MLSWAVSPLHLCFSHPWAAGGCVVVHKKTSLGYIVCSLELRRGPAGAEEVLNHGLNVGLSGESHGLIPTSCRGLRSVEHLRSSRALSMLGDGFESRNSSPLCRLLVARSLYLSPVARCINPGGGESIPQGLSQTCPEGRQVGWLTGPEVLSRFYTRFPVCAFVGGFCLVVWSRLFCFV